MSYLVLARKWRPQRFAEVIAQPHVVQALQNAIKLDRLPHALLLTGSRGVGKTTIARLVAKTVNCLKEDREEWEPCNRCDMCMEITEGRSVDVIEIDGASNRSIDDIRELRDNVQYTPTKGKRKVHIIDEVHMLTREAFNALLKTLEEPPPHVMFIFATTEPHKIPVTILSRCQRFDFKRIPTTVLRDHLRRIAQAEGVQLSEIALAMVARAAQGGARDAMSLMDQVIAFGGESPKDEAVAQAIGVINRQIMMEIGQALLAKDAAACLRAVDALFYFAYDLRQFTQELSAFLRDMMVVRICQDTEGIIDLTEEELAALRRLVQHEEPERIQQIFRILTQAAEEIAQSNHPRLLLEMTLIRMARVEPVRPFEDLISQLSALEGRLVGLAQEDPSQMRMTSHPSALHTPTSPHPSALHTSTLPHPSEGASIHAHLQRSLHSALATPEHLTPSSHSSGNSHPSHPSGVSQPSGSFGASHPSGNSQPSGALGASHPSQLSKTSAVPSVSAQVTAGYEAIPHAHTAPAVSEHAISTEQRPFGDDYLAATSERAFVAIAASAVTPTPVSTPVSMSQTAPTSTPVSMSQTAPVSKPAPVSAPSSSLATPTPSRDPKAISSESQSNANTLRSPPEQASSNGSKANGQIRSVPSDVARGSHAESDNEFSLEVWSRLIQTLAKEQGFLAGSLRAMAYRTEGDRLLLAYPPHVVQEMDETKRQSLERFLRAQGWALTVRFVKISPEQRLEFSPCLEEAKAFRARERQQALEEEVRQHDAIRAVMRVIPNAEIVRVTPLVLEEKGEGREDENES